MLQRSIIILLATVVTSGSFHIHAQDQYEKEYQKTYDENIKKEKINNVYIPKDVEDAMKELDRLSSPEGRFRLTEGSEEQIAKTLIFGLGKWMIVNWNFYEGSRLSHALKNKGVTLPDDMAHYLIISYYRYLKGLPMELDERAQAIFEMRKKKQEGRNKKKVVVN